MKRIKTFVLVVAGMMLLASCQSNQSKAEALAEKYAKETLYVPESYEAITVTVDTAYYNPIYDVEVARHLNKIFKYEEEANDAESELDNANYTMRINENMLNYPVMRASYESAKKRYDKAIETYEKCKNGAYKEAEEIIKLIQKAPMGKVVGWNITHRFRASSQNGTKNIMEEVIIADPEFKNVIMASSSEDQMFLKYGQKLAEIMGIEE